MWFPSLFLQCCIWTWVKRESKFFKSAIDIGSYFYHIVGLYLLAYLYITVSNTWTPVIYNVVHTHGVLGWAPRWTQFFRNKKMCHWPLLFSPTRAYRTTLFFIVDLVNTLQVERFDWFLWNFAWVCVHNMWWSPDFLVLIRAELSVWHSINP